MKYLLLLFLLPLSAYAGTAQLTCTAPTQNTDGSAITGAITYSFYRGTSATTVTTKLNATPTTTCAYTDNAAPVGTQYYAATAIVGGIESAKSAIVSKLIAAPIPNPPTLLTVDTVAMSVVADWSRLAFAPSKQVGTVALGIVCDAAKQLSGGYAAIPLASVVWSVSPSARPANVVAKCG